MRIGQIEIMTEEATEREKALAERSLLKVRRPTAVRKYVNL
jgi:hypothetical protein